MNRSLGDRSNNHGGYSRRRVFGSLLALGLGLVAWAMDYAYGHWSGVAEIREDARKFRAEAAPLRVATRSLVPSLHHVYPDPYRPEGSDLVPAGEPRRFSTNEVGTVASSLPRGKERVLFLGGSTTECNEVDEAYRFPAVVGELLRNQGADVEAINAGVRGHTSLDAINSLLNRSELASAHTIVLMENINDRLLLALKGDYGSGLGVASPTTGHAIWQAAAATLAAIWDYLAYRSNVLFFAINSTSWFGQGATSQGYVTERTLDELPPPSEQHQQLYEANLRVFVAAVLALGKRPVLMTQALGTHSAGQSLFNDSIRRVAGDTGTQLIDLDHKLPPSRAWAFLGDNIHLSNRGSSEVAQIITSELAPHYNTNYSRPATESGVIKLSELADSCVSVEGKRNLRAKLHQIVDGVGRYPSISPDGRWLLFQTRKNGLDRIRAQRISDGEVVDVTPPGARVHERHPAFLESSSDGFSVVFGYGTVGEQEGFERLMVRSYPSGTTRPLIDDAGLSGSIPTVRGQHVLFAGSRQEDGARVPNIYRYDLRTRQVERVLHSEAEQWRPTETSAGEVYFISDVGGRFAIYRRSVEGAVSKAGGSPSADEWDPAISPDGRWLAFASRRDGNWNLFVQAIADPSDQRRLTALPGDEWDPAWHPSGQLIVFGSAQRGEPRIMAMCADLIPQ